jgi:hypothetical protein
VLLYSVGTLGLIRRDHVLIGIGLEYVVEAHGSVARVQVPSNQPGVK